MPFVSVSHRSAGDLSVHVFLRIPGVAVTEVLAGVCPRWSGVLIPETIVWLLAGQKKTL